MNIKSLYYSYSKKQFDTFLKRIKESEDTICFFKNFNLPFYLYKNAELVTRLYQIDKKRIELDYLINSFSDFGKKQIVQSFMIDEIQASNKIENIFSTKHDIFHIINSSSTNVGENNKTKSITNTYKLLLENDISITKVEDIRLLYDNLMNGCLEKESKPDGKIFRKEEVFITDGQKTVHSGFYPEEKIIAGLNEFIDFYKSDNDVFLKAIVTHLLFETIHPFYDGNGRMGRFLMSLIIYKETRSIFSLLISNAFEQEKNKYYNAFKTANDVHSFRIINDYVYEIIEILNDNIINTIEKIKQYKENISILNYPIKLSKSELLVFGLLKEASILSSFGVSNEEIVTQTNLSKRTVIYTINKLTLNNLVVETKIGKYTYRKIKPE